MTEIKKTLSILKARWPEVTLIMGLYLLIMLLYYPLFGSVARRLLTPDKFALLALPMSYLLLAISATLRFGFLRTVYLQGNQRSSPLTLLRTGIYFLWRMVILRALYSIPFLVALLGTRIIAGLVSPESFAQSSFWINQLFFLAFSVFLVKLILLLPALVIVLDCRTFESFKFLKHCRLWEAKELVILFYAHLAFRFLLRFLRLHYDIPTASRYILEIGPLIISCFVNLIIAVMAVRFVASLHLVYDNDLSVSKSEDLPGEQFNSSV